IRGMMDLLTASIRIPVISTLYHDLTGEDLSFLDVICLIAAIPATIVHKAIAGAPPFPKGDAFTNNLLGAKSFADVKSAFFVPQSARSAAPRQASVRMAAARPAVAAAAGALHPSAKIAVTQTSHAMAASAPAQILDESKLKVFGVVAGCFAFFGSIVLVITSTIQKAL